MKIITFGSATWDTFIGVPDRNLLKERIFPSGEGIGFNLGSKIDLKDAYFGFGGGGVNSAFTFKLQGFDVSYCGSVGDDIPGREIIAELKKMGIGTSLMQKNSQLTNLSVIINSSAEDRTVLAYRGASEKLKKSGIEWDRLKASWFYLAPLSGGLSRLTYDIVSFAHKNGIKVAMNIGNSQIALGEKKLAPIFQKIDVLLMNEEEGALLAALKYGDNLRIMERIDEMHQGINVITRGSKGALISDRGERYDVSSLKIKVVDAIGAGDAFGSGFVSGLIKSEMDIAWSARLGIANALSAIKIKGATTGLLSGSDDFMPVGKRIKVRRMGVEKK